MKRAVSIVLLLAMGIGLVAPAALAQEPEFKLIRRIERKYYWGDERVKGSQIREILQNCGDPNVAKLLKSEEQKNLLGMILGTGGAIIMFFGIMMDLQDTGAVTAAGPVYVRKDTDDGKPLVIGGVLAGAAGVFCGLMGYRDYQHAIRAYNDRVPLEPRPYVQLGL